MPINLSIQNSMIQIFTLICYMELSCSLNWKKVEEVEDKSTSAVVPNEMIQIEVEEAAEDLCSASTQETPNSHCSVEEI